VLAGIGTRPAYRRMMAGFWSDGEMLRVERREPYSTQISKILPLHLLRN
jgi:hypothetical protein